MPARPPTSTPGTARCRRWRARGQDGSVSLEIAILAPALLLLVFSIVQGGLWFHARNLAQAAAQKGAAAGAAYNATTAEAVARARSFLSENAGDSLTSTSVTAAGSTTAFVRIEVTGRALSVLPGVPGLTVTQDALVPVERFTTDTP
jgi:Flp pilus assembly protein TadG